MYKHLTYYEAKPSPHWIMPDLKITQKAVRLKKITCLFSQVSFIAIGVSGGL